MAHTTNEGTLNMYHDTDTTQEEQKERPLEKHTKAELIEKLRAEMAENAQLRTDRRAHLHKIGKLEDESKDKTRAVNSQTRRLIECRAIAEGVAAGRGFKLPLSVDEFANVVCMKDAMCQKITDKRDRQVVMACQRIVDATNGF